MKSKFRNLFWIRIGMGFFVFGLVLYFCLDGLFQNTKDIMILPAFIVMLFLIYLSSGLSKIHTLTISENGIEIQLFLSRHKRLISFNAIIGFEYEKVRYRNGQGYISNGHKMCFLKLKNGERFLISPDTFENYDDLISSIKRNLDELD